MQVRDRLAGTDAWNCFDCALSPGNVASAPGRPTFFLVRHGESTGNQQGCLQGSRIGGALSERGQKQSAATASLDFHGEESH